jgi:hypothetical protein
MLLELNNNNKSSWKSSLTNLHSKDICIIQLFIIKLKLKLKLIYTSKSGSHYLLFNNTTMITLLLKR